IDRRVPLYLSSRMSQAARTIAAEAGFACAFVSPGEQLRIGDLTVTFYGPDHLARPGGDEWDTLAYRVDAHGTGASFFTNVDIEVPNQTRAALAEHAKNAELLTFESMTIGLFGADSAPLSAGHNAPSGTAFLTRSDELELLRGGRRLRPLPGQSI